MRRELVAALYSSRKWNLIVCCCCDFGQQLKRKIKRGQLKSGSASTGQAERNPSVGFEGHLLYGLFGFKGKVPPSARGFLGVVLKC